jgi:hypothetical protein
MLDKAQNEPDYAKLFVDDYDTRLPGRAFKFDWQKLGQIDDECMLVALDQRQIAWLEDVVSRLTHSGYYNEPDYIAALWGIDSKHADWRNIQEFSEEIRYCLMNGCKVSELVGGLKDINTTLKYILATKTNGTVPDYLFDPGDPERFATKVGLTLDELKEQVTIDYDYNPTDLDVGWPNMASFEGVGNNRRMVEEVPSVWIFDGWTADLSMAEMYAETMYYDILPKGEWPNGSIPHTQIMTECLERLDLAARNIDAKLSRSGRLDLNLPDVPQIRHPITGQRTELSVLLGQYGIPVLGPNGAPWPLTAWTKPSVFTAGAPRSDDPLGVFEEAFNYDTHVGETLAKGLIADWRPSIRLTEGLAPILTFPAINIPLPGNIGTVTIPPIPLYAGTFDAYVPGESGRGLADLLKQEEDVVIKSFDIPGMGTVEVKWEKHRISVKVPSLPSLPAGGIAPTWLPNWIAQRFLGGLIPGEFVQIWPYARTWYQRQIYNQTKIKNPGLGQLFKDILQIQDENPAYDANDPASKPTIDGATLAELFNLETDDPNLRPGIRTHAQILNMLQTGGSSGQPLDFTPLIQAIMGIKSAIDALELAGCCDDIKAISTVLETINESITSTADKIAEAIEKIQITNTNILSTGETASIAVDGCITGNGTGGSTNPSTGAGAQPAPLDQPLPHEQPLDKDDCEWIKSVLDTIVSIFEWILWAMEWANTLFGNSAVGKIIMLLSKSRYFVGLLVAAGLMEPSPAEEVATIPAATLTMLSVVITEAIDLGLQTMKDVVQALKQTKDLALSWFCDYDYKADEVEGKLDDWIDEVTRNIPDKKVAIRKMLEKIVKNSDIMRKFLYKPGPVNLLK